MIILKSNEIKTVAFDLGGVLAYQDLSFLSSEEKELLQIFQNYMNNKDIEISDKDKLEYAKSKMGDIYLKIHKLNSEAILTLDMLQQEGIKASIWTNNNSYIYPWFYSSGLSKYIKEADVINSFYVGFDNPNINFYYEALRILNLFGYEVLFFDDNYANIMSAKNCDINGVLYYMRNSLFNVVQENIMRSRRRN